jgi:hypothetical protein
LVSGVEIYYTEPLNPEADGILVMNSARVGATVLESCAHPREKLGRHVPARRTELSDDAAHLYLATRPVISLARAFDE